MANTGWVLAGSGSNNTTTGVDWVNPGNITVSDGSYAICDLLGEEVSDYLLASNFGFSIPTGATITLIEINVYRWAVDVGGGELDDAEVYLVKTGTTKVGTADYVGTWSLTPGSVATYNGPSGQPLWNTTWTPAEINSSGFGVVISVNEVGRADMQAVVNSVEARITYTPLASGPANLKTVNGLAKASVKTIDGVAIASVKTVNGLA
ncbi:MAG: hypothetical protein ABL959_21885 [Pyrinomonadaceae bacterium]